MRHTLTAILLALAVQMVQAQAVSPNGKVAVLPAEMGMKVVCNNIEVLDIPFVGYDGNTTAPALEYAADVVDDYVMVAGKRLHCRNQAKEYHALVDDSVTVVVRVYNDGVAFRYELNLPNGGQVPEEQTIYHIPEGTRRWMQQWTDAYEGFFPLSETANVKPVPNFSKTAVSDEGFNCRWGYPALIEPADGMFALITEANIEKWQSASCLYNKKDFFSVVPEKTVVGKAGKWHSPWRVVIVGDLKTVVESTLVTDVCPPSKIDDTSWINPGVVSWVYWAYNHGSNDFDIICKYVDMAATLQLPYVLIDAEWDEMKNGKTVEDAVAYALKNGVKPMIWYNSSVGWVNGAPGPKYRLNNPDDREREFAWCEKIGVAGVKVDFFSGDNQANMDYCLDLLESAARHHLLINFHGATIPRGCMGLNGITMCLRSQRGQQGTMPLCLSHAMS